LGGKDCVARREHLKDKLEHSRAGGKRAFKKDAPVKWASKGIDETLPGKAQSLPIVFRGLVLPAGLTLTREYVGRGKADHISLQPQHPQFISGRHERVEYPGYYRAGVAQGVGNFILLPVFDQDCPRL